MPEGPSTRSQGPEGANTCHNVQFSRGSFFEWLSLPRTPDDHHPAFKRTVFRLMCELRASHKLHGDAFSCERINWLGLVVTI